MEVQELQGRFNGAPMGSRLYSIDDDQRESSATIKAAPVAYEQAQPAKRKNVIEMDCRGLEFTDFKPDVRIQIWVRQCIGTDSTRANGRRPGWNRGRSLRA
jgi:hypothetical protein